MKQSFSLCSLLAKWLCIILISLGVFLLLDKLNSSWWLSENINLHLMFLVGLEWSIKCRPQNSTHVVELVTWRHLPTAGLPLDTFAVSAACGDVWQTRCMHSVTVRAPRWAFLIRGARLIEWLEKRVLNNTVWAQNMAGFLPKYPSPLHAARVLSDRAGRATYSINPPCRGWRMGPRFFWNIPLFVGTIWLGLLSGDIWLPEHLQDQTGRPGLASAHRNKRPEVGLVYEVWTLGQGNG